MAAKLSKKNEIKARKVKYISYFCIVKRFKSKIKDIALLFFLLLTHVNTALCQGLQDPPTADSIEISLLTCSPRPMVYSLYGHTAIRFQNVTNGTDLVVNYGVFSFDKPFFVLRFVFGLTDYEMGIEYFDDFKAYYERFGYGVKQQVLNITDSEKEAIAKAIDKNYEPQNRIYRYNYFYDNCTTRARDIITSNINGNVVFKEHQDSNVSYRKMIHKYNATHRWARFGNDLLLGVKADQSTTPEQQQFLPENLEKDFASAEIVGKDGEKRPLVLKEFWLVKPQVGVGSDSFPLSPTICACILSIFIIIVSIYEYVYKKAFWLLDAVLLLADGLCGLVLLAMVFSQHPTVSLNLQILLLNPLSLVFMWNTARSLRQQRSCVWIKLWPAFITLFLIGSIWQSYAEGTTILALSLLIRYILKLYQIKIIKKEAKNIHT